VLDDDVAPRLYVPVGHLNVALHCMMDGSGKDVHASLESFEVE